VSITYLVSDQLFLNISEQVAGGIAATDSIENFEKLLKRFPNDPALQKASADLLAKKNQTDAAALSYSKAATLFLKSGKLLPAIISKVYAWRLKSPSYQEAQLFLSAVRAGSFPRTPLKIFLEKLSNPEVLAVVKRFQNIHLPEQQLIQKVGDGQNDLEIMYHPVKTKEETVYKQSIINLSADDSIGDLYPIKEEKVCQSTVETIAPVELVKLSKKVLLQICKKYPNVEIGLQAVNVFRSESKKENLLRKYRQGIRHQLERKITIELYPQSSDNFPIILEGHSKDISIGGTSVVLDAKDLNVVKSIASFSKTIKNATVKISFPSEGLELKVSGKIAWTREVVFQRKKTLALGIQFQGLSPKLCGMLFVFADCSKKK